MTRVGGDSTQGGVPENYYMPYFAVCPSSEYFINSIKPASARAGSILRRCKLSSNFRPCNGCANRKKRQARRSLLIEYFFVFFLFFFFEKRWYRGLFCESCNYTMRILLLNWYIVNNITCQFVFYWQVSKIQNNLQHLFVVNDNPQ